MLRVPVTPLRALVGAIAMVAPLATPSFADPGVEVRYSTGVPEVHLIGSYAGTSYTAWRAPAAEGPWMPVTAFDVLCLGPCFAEERDAIPGRTYWYRFDLDRPDGSRASFGPYAVTYPTAGKTMSLSVRPNPASGPSRVEVLLGGAGQGPVEVDVTVFDPQGRAMRTLHKGPLPRGLSTLAFDGNDAAGRALRPGAYFVRTRSTLGTAIARFVRVR